MITNKQYQHICNGFMAQYAKSQRSNLWPFPINPSFWIHLTCGKLFYCFSCYCFTVLPVRIGPLSLLLGWSEDQQQTGPSPAFPSFEEILLELAEVSEYFWSTSSESEGDSSHWMSETRLVWPTLWLTYFSKSFVLWSTSNDIQQSFSHKNLIKEVWTESFCLLISLFHFFLFNNVAILCLILAYYA